MNALMFIEKNSRCSDINVKEFEDKVHVMRDETSVRIQVRGLTERYSAA